MEEAARQASVRRGGRQTCVCKRWCQRQAQLAHEAEKQVAGAGDGANYGGANVGVRFTSHDERRKVRRSLGLARARYRRGKDDGLSASTNRWVVEEVCEGTR